MNLRLRGRNVKEVLSRNKFGLDENAVNDLIDSLKKRAICFDRTESEEVFDDPDDVVFYEIVITARTATEAYLTRDLYPRIVQFTVICHCLFRLRIFTETGLSDIVSKSMAYT